MGASRITLLPSLSQWRLPWFQTDWETLHWAEACPRAEIQWDWFSRIYQGIILVLGDEFAVSHWDSSSRSRIAPHTLWWQKHLVRVLSLIWCWFEHCPWEEQVQCSSLSLLAGSAQKWALCRLFWDWREGSLARGFYGIGSWWDYFSPGKTAAVCVTDFLFCVCWFVVFLNDFLVSDSCNRILKPILSA